MMNLTLSSLPPTLLAFDAACQCSLEVRKDSATNFEFKIPMECVMTTMCTSTVVRLRSVERSDALMIQYQ